ncbi:MAG: type III restriction endonuclease subunit R [Nitrospirae bacterium]|nr:type III restriction endonuclease subunit R [Nitrospirota bacterium]
MPTSEGNYYERFNVVPPGLMEKLYPGKVFIINWHMLNWETDEKIRKMKSVDKRGAKSDEAYVQDVLGEMSNARNIVVINDEAHHACRVPAESKISGVTKEEIEEATKWVGGLDRIHKARTILRCYDLSATPFAPTGKKASEESLFGWIVSDFGLNDAIESGLVKTPRVVIHDDSTLNPDYKSRLYHIYNDKEVKDDLNRKAQPHEPLPDLLKNAYGLLGMDWLDTKESWESAGHSQPPVMITIANRTETAAQVKYAFDNKKILIDQLCIPQYTLHIDSKALELAESQIEAVENAAAAGKGDDDNSDEAMPEKLTKKMQAERMRKQVDTIGVSGQPGEKIRNIISVGMLTEGWDARTVTHIMGLRAFTSQLLCEQVVGRGLRRLSYDVNVETGFFDTEYVNIFGVPFAFLPHESKDGPPPPPTKPKTKIEPVLEKKSYAIDWYNIIRIERVYKPHLKLNMKKIERLELSAEKTITYADLAVTIDNKCDFNSIKTIDLDKLEDKFRLQSIVFDLSNEVLDDVGRNWKGDRQTLFRELVKITEDFIQSDKLVIVPYMLNSYERDRRIIIALNMTSVMNHIKNEISFHNTEKLVPVFDSVKPIRSTGDMQPWHTGRPCEHTQKSHINQCVYDSTWESSEAYRLDKDERVVSWVKNDHLGFAVKYVYNGAVYKYYPDFIIKLINGTMLILEVKGQERDRDRVKRAFLKEWVRAVNEQAELGNWESAVSRDPADIELIIDQIMFEKQTDI